MDVGGEGGGDAPIDAVTQAEKDEPSDVIKLTSGTDATDADGNSSLNQRINLSSRTKLSNFTNTSRLPIDLL